MHGFPNLGLKLSGPRQYAYRFLLTLAVLVPLLLSACRGNKAPATQAPADQSPMSGNAQVAAESTSTRALTRTPAPTETRAAASPTPTAPAAPADTATAAPTAAATAPAPTVSPTEGIPAVFFPPIDPYYFNMAADIQNNVNGVLAVLNVSGEDGVAYIILRTAYYDKIVQYNASYNLVKYLATYFKDMSEPELAKLFGGTQFSLHIKTISNSNEYIVDTTTSYAVLTQVRQAQVNQGQWEALVNAQIQLQYHVKALCSVKPNSIPANTDQDLLIEAWLLYQGKPVTMQYVSAAWKDSADVMHYCAGRAYDSSCHGPSGVVKSGSAITVDVAIQAADGLKYTCQASYSAP
jgi:hypothetical protein